MQNLLLKLSDGIGRVVSTFIQSGRDTVDLVISTILPFMAFVSVIVAVVNGTGIGELIAGQLVNLASNPLGLFAIAIITAIPFVSPIIAPGAVVPSIIGTMIGVLIGSGQIPVSLALPAIFAIHQPSGGDFIPVGLAMEAAENETVEIGITAVLYSKLIVAPIEMGVALLVSMFIYK